MSIEQEREALALLMRGVETGKDFTMPKNLYIALMSAYPMWGDLVGYTKTPQTDSVVMIAKSSGFWLESIMTRVGTRVAQQLTGHN